MTFNINIRQIFPENVIEIPQVVWKIWRFSSSILTILFSSSSWIFWHFLIAKKLMTSAYNGWCQNFFYLQPNLNRLFNNCVKLYWYWISSSSNIKGVGQFDLPPEKNTFKKPSFIRVNQSGFKPRDSLINE